MNDGNLEQLEDLLRELPVRRPSPELDRRVEAVWRARSSRWTRWTVAATVATVAAAAAGLLLMAMWNSTKVRLTDLGGPAIVNVEKPPSPQPVPPPEKSLPQPIVIEKVWTTQSTTGVVVHDGDVPMQQVHQQIVRHVRWIDEQNHVNIEWTIPSDQTVLVPLEYN